METRLPRNIGAHSGNAPMREKKGKDADTDKGKGISGSGSNG